MTHSTTVGVDLAKNVIQVSVVSARGKELSNRSLTRRKFAEFLGKQKPALVAFEACATENRMTALWFPLFSWILYDFLSETDGGRYVKTS